MLEALKLQPGDRWVNTHCAPVTNCSAVLALVAQYCAQLLLVYAGACCKACLQPPSLHTWSLNTLTPLVLCWQLAAAQPAHLEFKHIIHSYYAVRFLDVGCGCGYLAACAAMLVRRHTLRPIRRLTALLQPRHHNCESECPLPPHHVQPYASHIQVGPGGRVTGVDVRSACVELSEENVARLRATSPE